MVVPKINSSHGSETRNIINTAIDSINAQGKSIQDLVAKGQLTPTQYGQLISIVNGNIARGDVSVYDIDKNKGKIDQTYLTQDLIDAITGAPGANILSEVATESVTRTKLADNAVSADKTNFIDTSTNLLNISNLTKNKGFNNDGSALLDINQTSITDHINVVPGSKLTLFGVNGYVQYDSAENIVSRVISYSSTGPTTRLISDRTYSIRVEVYNDQLHESQINKGDVLLPYEPHYSKLNNIELGEKSVGIKETNFITESTIESNLNLFDKEAVTTGGYYDANTLKWVSNNEFLQSEFISAKQGDEIRLSETPVAHFVVFKNAQNEIFSGLTANSQNNRTFITPENAVSFSVNTRAAHSNNFMITKNRKMPDIYIPFGSVDFSDERLKESMMNYVRENIVINESIGKFKKINFLGDSITRGFEPLTGGQLSVTWASLVAREFGATERNHGLDSSNLAGTNTTTMVSRYPNMENDADLVIVSGGTNDWRSGVTLGTINDTGKTTFYGALKEMMDGLYTKYPNSTIVFCTPLHRVDDKSNNNGVDLKDFRNAIIEVGEMYGVAVLDLYATSGMYPDNTVNHNTYVPDGRHPNVAGHRKMASRIIGFLKTL